MEDHYSMAAKTHPGPYLSILIFFILSVTLTACSGLSNPSSSSISDNPAALDATVTNIPPTVSASMTPTPLVLPVGNGHPIPALEYEKLTAENMSRLEPIAKYGVPKIINITFDPRNKYILISTVDGVKILDSQTKKMVGEIQTRIPYGINVHSSEPEPRFPAISGDGEYILLFNQDLDLDLWSIRGEKVWTKEMRWKSQDAELKDANELSASISPGAGLLAQSNCRGYFKCTVTISELDSDQILDEFSGSYPLFTNTGDYLTYITDTGIGVYDVKNKETDYSFLVEGLMGSDLASQFYREFNLYNLGLTNRVAIVLYDRVIIYDLGLGKQIANLSDFTPGSDKRSLPGFVAFSPNGEYVLIGTYPYPQKVFKFKVDQSVVSEQPYDGNKIYWVDDDGVISNYQKPNDEYFPPGLFSHYLGYVQMVFYESDPVLYGFQGEYSQVDGNWVFHYTQHYQFTAGKSTVTPLEPDNNYAYFNDDGRMISITGPVGEKRCDVYINDSKVVTLDLPNDHLEIRGVSNNVMAFTNVENSRYYYYRLLDLTTGKVLGKWAGEMVLDDAYSDRYIAFKIFTKNGGWIGDDDLIVYDTLRQMIVFSKKGYQENNVFLLDDLYSLLLVETTDDGKKIQFETIDLETRRKTSEAIGPTIYNYSRGSSDNSTAYDLSINEQFVAMSDLSGKIMIFDIPSNEFIYQWNAHMDSIDALKFSTDGRFLASFSKDGYLIVWGIPK